MGWKHGQNERREITKNIWDKEASRLQKTRKTIAKMRDLRKAEEKEKWREKANKDQWIFFYKSSRTTEWQLDHPHHYKKGSRGRTRNAWNEEMKKNKRARTLREPGGAGSKMRVCISLGSAL